MRIEEEDQKIEDGSKREGIVLRIDFLFLLKNTSLINTTIKKVINPSMKFYLSI
jgi:hypothetical protein